MEALKENRPKNHWYDSNALLVTLFFIFPPLGIYGVSKKKTDSWKKILYIVPAAFSTFFIIVALLAIAFTDNYETGLDYYNKQDYVKAYDNLIKVSPGDKNYKDAILKRSGKSNPSPIVYGLPKRTPPYRLKVL